ncbi:hypothetical protein O1611_g1779 [Lasiodiplodia mahajangana]|uniref:Uncharacterized protein n=1 Tax=Lasiodiplodia mahajangana TaxID=1108764 RepID=A0ACC2JWE1_9PEZI|nr:hypothetical protein O1611_g1779 [Lasiodiplodia mahajangana]
MPPEPPNNDQDLEAGHELAELQPVGHSHPNSDSSITLEGAQDPEEDPPQEPPQDHPEDHSEDEAGPAGDWIVEPVEDGVWEYAQKFCFSWYSWPTALGIISHIIYEFSQVTGSNPYFVYASVGHLAFYCVIFVAVTIVTIIRYCKWPRLFFVMMKHPRQAIRVASGPMALAPIITMWARLSPENTTGPQNLDHGINRPEDAGVS